MSLTTHVLDMTTGRPAAGVQVSLDGTDAGVTDAGGRLRLPPAGRGSHDLAFGTGDYFAARGVVAFHPAVTIRFTIDDPDEHHHVPLLVGPFSYTTYRGS